MSQVRPDECYHLAAQSFVAESFKDPFSSVHINIMGTLNILESVRQLVPECRFYFAASSEMFGEVQETPQTENTPFYPRSPYGVTKVAGFDLTRNYRESYGLFGCSGILFNHESPRRGYEFVTRKISSNIAGIVNGTVKSFSLGNINAKRDWGYAGDFVQAMWLMLQQDDPDDYVIATGETHSIKDFLDAAFDIVDLRWEDYVTIDPKLYRPAEVHLLRGDSTKANVKLGWEPKISFRELVARMVACDLMIK
jgi:GDPmannose 4,6-dehydratase